MAASIGTDRVNPNLTPLLDVVLQLIMFFMITVNFVSEQVNQNVKLPSSASAQEIMSAGDIDVLVINIEVVRRDKIDANGDIVRDQYGRPIREMVQPKTTKIIFTGVEEIVFKEGEEPIGLAKSQKGLASLARQLRILEGRRRNIPADQIKLDKPVVIRADADTQFGLVLPIMNQCRAEGFPKVSVRAESITQSLGRAGG